MIGRSVDPGHGLDDLAVESLRLPGNADDRRRPQGLDRRQKIGTELMIVGIGKLMADEIGTAPDDKSLGIDKPSSGGGPPPATGRHRPSPRPSDRRCRYRLPGPEEEEFLVRQVAAGDAQAEKMPATVTEAVPWISSLKQQTSSRYFCSSRKALRLAKSSNWIIAPGYSC